MHSGRGEKISTTESKKSKSGAKINTAQAEQINCHKARSETTRTDRQWRQMNDRINQQIDKWMEGWVDRWKAKGENEQYLNSKRQRLW